MPITASAQNKLARASGSQASAAEIADAIDARQGTPGTVTDTASLSDAQMLSGIIEGTPTSAANYTVRTGTQIEAAIGGTLVSGDQFELVIINLGGAGDTITLVAATGVTIVGSAVVYDAGADITSSGVFRFVRGAANVFVAYRVG